MVKKRKKALFYSTSMALLLSNLSFSVPAVNAENVNYEEENISEIEVERVNSTEPSIETTSDSASIVEESPPAPPSKQMQNSIQDEFNYTINPDNTITIDGPSNTISRTDLQIPELIEGMPVTHIAQKAFQNLGIVNLMLPETIQEIGEAAFMGNLIERFEFPRDIKTIHSQALLNNNIKQLNLNRPNISFIGKEAFASNPLESLHITAEQTDLGESTFSKNTGTPLQILIDAPVDRIGAMAFADGLLGDVLFDEPVQVIGHHAFSGASLGQLRVKNPIQTIENHAFFSAEVNGSVIFEEAVNKAEFFSFSAMNVQEDIIFEDNLLNIGEFAFSETHGRDFITKGATNTIEKFSFTKSKFNNISIPKFNGNIDNFAFDEINVQETLYIAGKEIEVKTKSDSIDNFTGIFTDATIGSLLIEAETIPVIGGFTFEGITADNITIKGNITEIGEFAFANANIIETRIIGDINRIGSFAFNRGTYSDITVEGRIDTTGEHTFTNSTFNEIHITGGIREVGPFGFAYSNIQKLDVLKGLEMLRIGAFMETKLNQQLVIPQGVKTENVVFYESEFLSLDITGLVSTTSNSSMFNGISLANKSLQLPDYMIDLEPGAIFGATSNSKLERLRLAKKTKSIGENAISHQNLSCITIPDTIESIDQKAFEGNLQPLTIWGTVGTAAEKLASTNGYTFKEDNFFTNTCDPNDWNIKVNYSLPDETIISTNIIEQPAPGSHKITGKAPKGFKLSGHTNYTVIIDEENPNHEVTFNVEAVAGTVTVNYVTEEGQLLDSKVVTNLPLGAHEEIAKTFEGYTIVGESSQSLELTEANLVETMTFIYKPILVAPEPTEPETPPVSTPEPIQPETPPVTSPDPTGPVAPPVTIPDTSPTKPTVPEQEEKDERNKRAIRDEGNGKYTTVPHYLMENNKLKPTTKYPEGVIIVDRVKSPFTDIQKMYSYQEIEDLFNYLITVGTTPTTFSPNKSITRGQLSAMIYRALELRNSKRDYTFKDVRVYQEEVQALYDAGIVTGFEDGTFKEGETVSRQQAAAMITRMLEYLGVSITEEVTPKFEDGHRISEYARKSVNYLASHEILVSGQDINFRPKDNLTRAQMAKILMNSLRLSDWY